MEPTSDAARRSLRAAAGTIFGAALAAVDPTRLVAAHLRRVGSDVVVTATGKVIARWGAPTLVVGGGKAAARMAAGVEAVLGSDSVRGEVVVADGCGVPLASIAVSQAGHPLPDARGAAAAARLLNWVARSDAGGVLCLISGGASSLLGCPRPPVTLHDKIAVTRMLLACGAAVDEINTVRKHLSLIKGGGLLRCAHVPVVSLLISDVVGDDPSIIGSAPSLPDPTTFADAQAVCERYGLVDRLPPAVRELLSAGIAGRQPETVKPGSSEAGRGTSIIIGSNATALAGAAAAARASDWEVVVEPTPLLGDTTAAARAFGARLRDLARARRRVCVLAGGETTVRLRGGGRGGRNQEFALVLAESIAAADVVVLSAGSDGIDGPTDAAGAFVDGATMQRAAECGLDAAAALAQNDSYTFFAALGDLVRTGPTGTNVMDVKVALVGGQSLS